VVGRRGVTLVEMLVTLAILLLIMTVIVQIFQAATGAMSGAQAFQELDNELRQLDATIRADLRGVTARLTPPLNPKDNLGYFEYGENSFADLQGEDSDDYVRFTAKAPAGHPFVGRFWPKTSDKIQNTLVLPITITSDYAEIIYFLRNGNLYRRVLLVAPDRQASIVQMQNNLTADAVKIPFKPTALGGLATSWQGVNDLSARPASTGPNLSIANTFPAPIVLNTLGDLTNRENRFASPRFANDFVPNNPSGPAGPDGLPDDQNNDGVPDFYPTLYVDISGATWFWTSMPYVYAPNYGMANNGPNGGPPTGGDLYTMAFPYVFPGAYSKPENDRGTGYVGWIHSPTPDQGDVDAFTYVNDPLNYLRRLNHNPLDVGDNLFRPNSPTLLQTWWGFPTWRETLSPGWGDPTVQVNMSQGQPIGLAPRRADYPAGNGLGVGDTGAWGLELLPPMSTVNGITYRKIDQLFSDGFGTNSIILSDANNQGVIPAGNNLSLWGTSWEDDLIMTGVRSFDIKAYDSTIGSFVDLGWGDDARFSASILGGTGSPPYPMPNLHPFLSGNYDFLTGLYPTNGDPLHLYVNGAYVDLLQSMAHEGRMPPLLEDNRFDAQFGVQYYPGNLYTGYNGNSYNGNIGNDGVSVVRLRRVWDSWSTDYTNAPAYAIKNDDLGGGSLLSLPVGPPYRPPIYPSYPPPYPAPLRGIQIQIRVVDPTNQRVKQMTIRHDFTDRL
jgi:prepilin-type N-terminal cleavage/methylation domain-containing protein